MSFLSSEVGAQRGSVQIEKPEQPLLVCVYVHVCTCVILLWFLLQAALRILTLLNVQAQCPCPCSSTAIFSAEFHPLEYINGLAEVLKHKYGVKIYEGTRVHGERQDIGTNGKVGCSVPESSTQVISGCKRYWHNNKVGCSCTWV
jgi:hypothetical protein